MNPRELEILKLLGRGDRISEVASELGISYKAVANTTSMLKSKLGAKNHSDLVRIAVEIDLYDWDPVFRPLSRNNDIGESSTHQCHRAVRPLDG
ncbi:DNA-binding CsgD family transcriptional regulator [Bradyrhizobium sp. S3.2.12]